MRIINISKPLLRIVSLNSYRSATDLRAVDSATISARQDHTTSNTITASLNGIGNDVTKTFQFEVNPFAAHGGYPQIFNNPSGLQYTIVDVGATGLEIVKDINGKDQILWNNDYGVHNVQVKFFTRGNSVFQTIRFDRDFLILGASNIKNGALHTLLKDNCLALDYSQLSIPAGDYTWPALYLLWWSSTGLSITADGWNLYYVHMDEIKCFQQAISESGIGTYIPMG